MASERKHPLRDWEPLRPLFLDDASFRHFIDLHQRDLAATGEVQISLGTQLLGRLLGPELTREFAYFRSFRRLLEQVPETSVAETAEDDERREWKPGGKRPRVDRR